MRICAWLAHVWLGGVSFPATRLAQPSTGGLVALSSTSTSEQGCGGIDGGDGGGFGGGGDGEGGGGEGLGGEGMGGEGDGGGGEGAGLGGEGMGGEGDGGGGEGIGGGGRGVHPAPRMPSFVWAAQVSPHMSATVDAPVNELGMSYGHSSAVACDCKEANVVLQNAV